MLSPIKERDYYPPSPPLSATTTTSDQLNLERVVKLYGSQPELLELILSSKLEEDRRRAEEAKLRRKEIDFMLQKKQAEPTLPFTANNNHHALPSLKKLNHEVITLPSPTNSRRRSIEMLLNSPNPNNLKLPEIHSSNNKRTFTNTFEDHAELAPLSPPSEFKKRKREMQAITTIIETKEFPYNDDYLWKNNGNTIHKKTGFKSIYYKCSNSSKGCPVNKTVTFKDNGEYLIKYRGEHLIECNRIKRIMDL